MKRIRLPHLPGKVIYQANQMNQRCYLQIMVQFFLYICVCLAFENLVHSAKWCQRKLYCRKPLVSLGTWVWVEITEGRLNIQIPTIKTKLIYLIPFHPPHYFWFTMALSGPDLQQWQIAHLIVSRPINQGGSSRLRQMVRLCADSPFTLDGCVIVYQLFTSVSSQMWHCLVLEAK